MNPFIRPARCESAACVEVSIGDEVTVRSSRDPDRTVVFTLEEWAAFISSVRLEGRREAVTALVGTGPSAILTGLSRIDAPAPNSAGTSTATAAMSSIAAANRASGRPHTGAGLLREIGRPRMAERVTITDLYAYEAGVADGRDEGWAEAIKALRATAHAERREAATYPLGSPGRINCLKYAVGIDRAIRAIGASPTEEAGNGGS